jgi:glycosyltransferase involved in cell wall biosynthesis
MHKPTVTIITPVHNEELGIDAWAAAVMSTLISQENVDFRVLLVEDGSTDKSWQKIQELCGKSSKFSGIRLSRNFGSHVALSAGVAYAQGDALATLACDLQDPPEVILEFVEKWRNGADIVWGVRRTRQDSWLRLHTTDFFIYLLRRYAMPRGSKFTTGSFLLMDKKVAECFRQFREHSRVTFALVAWTGFDQCTVPYDRRARLIGSSGWTLSKTLRTIYDAFIGFSDMPARLMTLTGVVTFVGSLLLLVYLIGCWLTTTVLPGWTGVMVLITFFFGLLFIMIGMIGEYMYRIFLESTGRPLYFVSATSGRACDSDGEHNIAKARDER